MVNEALVDSEDEQKNIQQSETSYWFNVVMHIITNGPNLEDSQELIDLLDELDSTQELFTITSDEFFIMCLF